MKLVTSVLSAYLKCLNDTTRTCRGILQFYTNVYSMKKQWQQYQCELFKPKEETENRSSLNRFYTIFFVKTNLNYMSFPASIESQINTILHIRLQIENRKIFFFTYSAIYFISEYFLFMLLLFFLHSISS
uniref:RGM_N domain-containing protein n=1 Tax=Heterorhabditis bacteriophora TaxID=37862 RepID=A0A1I7WF43_HETBA